MINTKGYKEDLYTKGCMRTQSGIYVDILNPKPEMFEIEDIAHALSMIPRFGGHMKRFYSVAEHCIRCAIIAEYIPSCCSEKERKEFVFDALMHDASEAYLGDMISPIKQLIPQYKELEHKFMTILASKFGFNWPLTYSTKFIDSQSLKEEWELFISNTYLEVRSRYDSKVLFLRMFNTYKPTI